MTVVSHDSPRRKLAIRRAASPCRFLILALLLSVPVAEAQTLGQVMADIFKALPPPRHVSQSASLAPDAQAPEPDAFRPPSVFSAPLPSGSGARALGLAGAFTALADDATAASWNPAGLIQLERPEASFMLRYNAEQDVHRSQDADFRVGTDDFDSSGLNYLSVVFPFYFIPLQRNIVISLNHQEAYDFTQSFNAKMTGRNREDFRTQESDSFSAKERVGGGRLVYPAVGGKIPVVNWSVDQQATTETRADLRQILETSQAADVAFSQKGVVSALSPAFAAQITPKLSIGTAVNYFMIDPLTGDSIESRTRASYSGEMVSTSDTAQDRTTSGNRFLNVAGTIGGGFGILVPINIKDLPLPAFAIHETTHSRATSTIAFDGVYEEHNRFTDLHGLNATFGAMWTVNRLLTLGATVDLPWRAKAKQSQRVKNKVTTYSADRSRVLGTTESDITVSKDVTFSFPLYWAVGSVWRWTHQFYTTFDVSRTHWSDFAFEAQGEGKINPFDGTPHGQNPIKDTWSVRTGMEYLLLPRNIRSEIPLRAGFAWEQRPALESPDNFYSLSLGSGFSIGDDPGKIIVDLAYIYTFANGIRGAVPEQASLRSDVKEHQGFVSAIKHF